jgi:hypothetical protein
MHGNKTGLHLAFGGRLKLLFQIVRPSWTGGYSDLNFWGISDLYRVSAKLLFSLPYKNLGSEITESND